MVTTSTTQSATDVHFDTNTRTSTRAPELQHERWHSNTVQHWHSKQITCPWLHCNTNEAKPTKCPQTTPSTKKLLHNGPHTKPQRRPPHQTNLETFIQVNLSAPGPSGRVSPVVRLHQRQTRPQPARKCRNTILEPTPATISPAISNVVSNVKPESKSTNSTCSL